MVVVPRIPVPETVARGRSGPARFSCRQAGAGLSGHRAAVREGVGRSRAVRRWRLRRCPTRWRRSRTRRPRWHRSGTRGSEGCSGGGPTGRRRALRPARPDPRRRRDRRSECGHFGQRRLVGAARLDSEPQGECRPEAPSPGLPRSTGRCRTTSPLPPPGRSGEGSRGPTAGVGGHCPANRCRLGAKMARPVPRQPGPPGALLTQIWGASLTPIRINAARLTTSRSRPVCWPGKALARPTTRGRKEYRALVARQCDRESGQASDLPDRDTGTGPVSGWSDRRRSRLGSDAAGEARLPERRPGEGRRVHAEHDRCGMALWWRCPRR